MEKEQQEIPIIWKKPYNSSNLFHIGTINILLDQFIKRYRKRLQIQHIMIDLEMPKDAAGFSNKTFIVKLHLKLLSGKILIAESERRSIADAIKNIWINGCFDCFGLSISESTTVGFQEKNY